MTVEDHYSEPSPSSGEQSEPIVGVCPSCQNTVMHTAEQLLRSRGTMTLAYGLCASCRTPVFTLMVGHGVVHTSVGVCTDLQRAEIEKFWSTSSPTENDILSLHERLNEKQSTRYFTHHIKQE